MNNSKLIFLVIENSKPYHETLWFALKDAYGQETTISPSHDQPCDTWDKARVLLTDVPAGSEIIVIADLALKDSDPNDAKHGVNECYRLHQLRPEAKFIAFTAFEKVLISQEAKEVFFLLLSKYDEAWNGNPKAKAAYLKEKIESVRQGLGLELPSPICDLGAVGARVFISHSHKDSNIAHALVSLLQASLGLQKSEMICTSVDGAGISSGYQVGDELRRQIRTCSQFVSILTPNALNNDYVMFEMGARWGMGLPHTPLVAKGTQGRDLPRPIIQTLALDITIEAKIHQLLKDLGTELKIKVRPASEYLSELKALSRASTSELIEKKKGERRQGPSV